jgi:hypothetical protein
MIGPAITPTDGAFEQCVRDCARDPQIVQRFNEYNPGVPLTAPIQKLLDGTTWDMDSDISSEDERIACFIMFVYMQVWRRVLFASRRFVLANRTRDRQVTTENLGKGQIVDRLESIRDVERTT